MIAMLKAWDWGGEATVALARTSQAAVIESFDRVSAWPVTAPGVRDTIYGKLADLTGQHLEEPALLAERPYALLDACIALHSQFVQRLLEVLDERTTQGGASGLADVLDLSAHRASAAR